MKTKLLISGLALMALTIMVNAQDPVAGKRVPENTGVAYVDSNNDGVCDNFTINSSNRPAGNRFGNNPRGNNPNQKQGTLRQGQGRGQGMRQGIGQGMNRNFVDSDKNGVCDRFESSAKSK